MAKVGWLFKDSHDTRVTTTTDVIIKRMPILFVSHDSDDGMWQFHSGEDVNMDDAMLVSLKEIVDYDATVTKLANLPLGWIAWRDRLHASWSMKEILPVNL
ncbi:hypothetical protein WMW72_28305 [Paenibacillus filicis]|uniref:DUF2185 domain-containing protein n=1 Tax=Paenibacillus filicis TaxID=669464 RepID=A0ABU9DSG8_9BACL